MAGDVEAFEQVVDILAREGIQPRRDDGTLRQINLSVPTMRRDVIVAGLRYVKRDGTHTEDHFVFDLGSPSTVDRFYRAKLEGVFSESRGAHKQRADFDSVPNYGLTFPNTITFNT